MKHFQQSSQWLSVNLIHCLEITSKIKVLFSSFSSRPLLSCEKGLSVYLNIDELLSKESKQREKNSPQECVNSKGFSAFALILFPFQTAVNLRDLSPCPLTLLEANEQGQAQIFNPRERENAEIISFYSHPPFTVCPPWAATPGLRCVSTCRGLIPF